MLNDKSLVALIERCKDGDDTAFTQLVHHYTPLIRSLIGRWGLDFDECHSEACMSLYKAVMSFNSEQDAVTFGLYAQICIFRRLSDLAKYARTEQRLSDVDVDNIAVPGSIDARLVAVEESREFRKRAEALLSEYEYGVFLMWLDGNKTAAIAAALGQTAKSVDNAKNRIIRKLRDGLPPPRG